jgi:N-acylneuraminate cytidylyltransferase
MPILFLITAREGSKGLPGKNVKPLKGKPLIAYSIEFALKHKSNSDHLCISTNDLDIVQIAKEYNVQIPFIRPEHLATDAASTYDVILHALNHYNQLGQYFDQVLLLQPTSPYRTTSDFENVLNAFSQGIDMVVTVKISKANPYYNLFEENESGFLIKCKDGEFTRRQDCPQVYEYNGSIYLISVDSLQRQPLHEFNNVRKVIMPESRSIDIDNMQDWVIAEYWYNEYLKSLS